MNWFTSMLSGKTSEGDAISASTLNVTKIVSIFIAIFAAITQGLAASNTVSLNAAQQVTVWLVVAGLIVLLSITDMICRAYVTAKRYGSGEVSVTDLKLPHVNVQKHGEPAPREAQLLGILTGGSGQFAHIQWKDGSPENDKDAWVQLSEVHSLN